MQFELKKLSSEAVPAALERAKTYRLLNEPVAAESICRDVLDIEPDHQEAIIEFVLALTDQFGGRKKGLLKEANAGVEKLTDDYHRAYYGGIVLERGALAHVKMQSPGCGFVAYDWLRDAMQHYERAQELRPSGNDESILRWNTCARTIMNNREIREREESPEPIHDFDS